MSRDYKHQCRYCSYCVYTIEDTWWCDLKDEYCERPKRPNNCDKWLFNKIPADGPMEKEYKPRKPRLFKQMRLDFDGKNNNTNPNKENNENES